MSFTIPTMQYDKRLNIEEATKLLEFIDKYIKVFQDDMAQRTYERIVSTRFFGKGPFEILNKRRDNFSDDEIDDPEFFYIQKYKKVISKLVLSDNTSFTNPYKLDLSKLRNLLDFFENQGYLTKKQMKLISFLLRKFPKQTTPPEFTGKINTILHHHIKKDFMKGETAIEIAEIIADIGVKKVIPKKKMILSLSQIRSELSANQ